MFSLFTAEEVVAMIHELSDFKDSCFVADLEENLVRFEDRKYKPNYVYRMLAETKTYGEFLDRFV